MTTHSSPLGALLPQMLVALTLLAACGDDAAPPPPRDAATDPAPDARADAGTDASPDADASDTGADADADAEEDAGLVPCSRTILELASDPISSARNVSAAVTPRGFAFGWYDSAAVREQARIGELADGASEPVVRFLTDDDNSARDVQVAEGFALWVDDGGTGEHNLIRGINSDSTRAEPQLLSASTGQHASPRIFADGDGWLAVWSVQGDSGWTIQIRRFDGESMMPIQSLPWTLPAKEFAIDFVDDVFYAAWTDEGAVTLALADTAGAETRAPEVVSESTNASPGHVALAFGDGFGLIAYGVVIESVRFEVRSRLMTSAGEVVRPSQVVSRAPLRGRLPVVASYAGGYVVAYHASNTDREEHLRISFIHGSDGDVVAEYDLGESPFDGGAAGVAVDDDGELGVGWADVDPARDLATIIRGARLQCEDAWLRCSEMR